jgi:hypothetical protein
MSRVSERAQLAEWRDALRDSELDSTAKLLGFVLSTWWDRNGRGAFPSKPTMAAASGLSKRAVDGAVNRLETAGFIDVSRSRGRTSNRYSATLPTVQPPARLNGPNRASDDSQPCKSRPLTVQVAAPESAESAESVFTRASRARGKKRRAPAARFPDLSAYDR